MSGFAKNGQPLASHLVALSCFALAGCAATPPQGPAAPKTSALDEATTTVRSEPPAEQVPKSTTAEPPDAEVSNEELSASPPPELTCSEEMALVRRAKGPYCIDKWEASLVRLGTDGKETPWPSNENIDGRETQFRAVSVPGRRPQGYISGKQADQVCRRSKKRLCEIDEWVVACRGPKKTTYPYGNERRANVCNDRFKILDRHPIPRLFRKAAPPGTDPKEMWMPKWMDDKRIHEMSHTLVPTGSKKECTNEHGVYDMVGNLHEWVADPEGTFFGGFFMDTFQNGHGCGYRTIGHPFGYHDYSIGFRCCSEPSAVAPNLAESSRAASSPAE